MEVIAAQQPDWVNKCLFKTGHVASCNEVFDQVFP
jgi:hypothetical protein